MAAAGLFDDWLERVLSCFYREIDGDKLKKKDLPNASGDPLNLDPGQLRIDENNLDEQFSLFLAQLELSEEKEKELFGLSSSKKMAMLRSRHSSCADVSAAWVLQVLNSLSALCSSPPEVADHLLAQLQIVVTALRTRSHDFLDEFLTSGGLGCLSSLLLGSRMDVVNGARAAFLLLSSIRALLNSNQGRRAVLNCEKCLTAILGVLDIQDYRCKISAIEILSGLCFVPEDGHKQVLTAITQATSLLGERTRLQRLVELLHRELSSERDTDRLRTAVMSLINALLRTGYAENSTEFRLHLRYELLMLGIQEILERIRSDASPRLEDHIDLFEMMRREDEMSLGGNKGDDDSGASSPIDFESASGMAEALSNRLSHSVALSHFISLLQHLFMVPCDDKHIPLWRLFDLLLQNICLQSTLNGISDVHPSVPTIDMNDVLSRLHTHCDYERVERELERLKEQLVDEKTRNSDLENSIATLRAEGGVTSSAASRTESPMSEVRRAISLLFTIHNNPSLVLLLLFFFAQKRRVTCIPLFYIL